MGVIKQGILGGVAGKVGTVVGGNWKGIDYLRSRPASVANPNTTSQQTQRTRFSTVLGFLKPFTAYIGAGFKNYAKGMTEFNVAMSYNVKNAVAGTFPNFTMDYPNVQLTKGNLTGVLNPRLSSGSSLLTYEWDDNSGTGNALATDLVCVAAYFPNQQEGYYQLMGTNRSFNMFEIQVPNALVGQTAQCWISFVTADGKEFSNSTYAGSVRIA